MAGVRTFRFSGLLLSGVLAALGSAGRAQVTPDGNPGALRNHSIGYVMTSENRAIYETPDGKAECPQGFNDGPREQLKILYPDESKRSVVGARLAREAETWLPSTSPEALPYRAVQGKTGLGLDLDGKVGPDDFTGPNGETGIDNQLYRAIGCSRNFRAEGNTSITTPQWRTRSRYNIFVIELTNVDTLMNSGQVTVTTYRGMDRLLADATGANYLPGGTQTVDLRWGKRFIQKFRGKIVDGVLTTEPADLIMPAASMNDPRDGAPDILFHDMRFRLKLSPDQADGFMGGYADIESWYYDSIETRSTHHQSYGGVSTPSMYRALRHFADAYPDPKSGENTAISAAIDVKFTQVYVRHGS